MAVEIANGVVTEWFQMISVMRFCDELRSATLGPARDDESSEGENLWELFDELWKHYPVNCRVCVMLPRKTVDEAVTTVEELVHRAGIIGHEEGLVALKKRLTIVPPSIAVVMML